MSDGEIQFGYLIGFLLLAKGKSIPQNLIHQKSTEPQKNRHNILSRSFGDWGGTEEKVTAAAVLALFQLSSRQVLII